MMKLATLAVFAQTLQFITPSLAAAVPADRVELAFDNSKPTWNRPKWDYENRLSARQSSDSSSCKHETRQSDGNCTNGPTTRSCWSDGFSIATDMDYKWPETGVTRTYDLEITNITLAPDGVERLVLAVNGQYPGPTLYADWGDTMVVNVKNSMEHNGTSIHWHGLRMLNANKHDGVNGVTECPLAPGQTKQYIIPCTQHGTSWYHSHHSVQYGDGVLGGIVINGPATANYDTDLGTMSFTDWYYHTAFSLNDASLHTVGPPPLPDTGLINGTMVSGGINGSSVAGAYHVTTLTQGKRYRLRLINTGVDNAFHVSIDNHDFTVISADFVPIRPYTTRTVFLAVGQRYDIVINANQPVGNYWLRADTATSCAKNKMAGRVKSIIRYEGAQIQNPISINGTAASTFCIDEVVTPYNYRTVPEDQFDSAMSYFSIDFNVAAALNNVSLVQWFVNDSTIFVDWEKPTIQNVLAGNYTFNTAENVYSIKEVNDAWSFWVLQTVLGDPVELAHPVHLHGHDFFVLGSGVGMWNGDKSDLTFDNPIRRDTASLPASGWLVLAFPADNPGLWLMHCHIPWHVGAGFSVQFLERKEDIVDGYSNITDFTETCDTWSEYWDSPGRLYEQDDSGL